MEQSKFAVFVCRPFFRAKSSLARSAHAFSVALFHAPPDRALASLSNPPAVGHPDPGTKVHLDEVVSLGRVADVRVQGHHYLSPSFVMSLYLVDVPGQCVQHLLWEFRDRGFQQPAPSTRGFDPVCASSPADKGAWTATHMPRCDQVALVPGRLGHLSVALDRTSVAGLVVQTEIGTSPGIRSGRFPLKVELASPRSGPMTSAGVLAKSAPVASRFFHI